MSGKLLNSFRDENRDLQKQIGCMNGIFQFFDGRHFLSKRRISSQNQKRLPPGQSGNHGMESSSMTQETIENLPKEEAVKEKQRVSVESSRTSVSSSCSSTFSSVDCNKIAHPEPSSFGHSIFPGTKQSLDLRDVVKDSISRETYGLSLKTKVKGVRHVVKNVDSPRPLQLSKSVNPEVSSLDGSFRVIAKLREAPQSSNKEKSRALSLKDAPRFSYDGRESRDTWKSSIKLKELFPRLSLDSREGSIRRSAFESRSNYLLDDLQRRNGKTIEPERTKQPTSVVAKLMGLEVFPDSVSGKDDQERKIKCFPDEGLDTISNSSRKADESKHNQVSRSPRTLQREPASPQLRNVKGKSKFPLEPAPWRQPEGNRGSRKPVFIYREANTKTQNSCPSVYNEIEKRLTELEFKRSGKDLRALKQIPEAMQKTKEKLDASDSEPQTSTPIPNYRNFGQNSILPIQCSQITPTMKSESSIVIIKPAKVVQKPRNAGSTAIPIEGISGLHILRTRSNTDSRKDSVDKQTAKDLTPRNNHFREPSCRPVQSMDKRTNARSVGNPTFSGRNSTTVSPRLQQKKHGMEKQSHPTIQTSDSRRARRHLTKQQIQAGSPSRKFKPKSPNLQHSDDQLTEFSSETRHLSHQGDAISVQSESNTSLASETMDIEVTSTDRSKEINGANLHKNQKNEIVARLIKDRSKAELTTATLEQPSPVSVLDITFYGEESPSPVKKKSNAFKDEETLNSDEAEWNLVDLHDLLNSKRPHLSPDFGREKLENIKHLVHKLRQVNSTHNEASTDYIASLCENKNPEHRYITEILLASGIMLKDLGSSSTIIQFHPSGHLINPNLFLVLEQTKGRIELPDDERSTEKIDKSKFNQKIHRKLIFDTVNEILVHKVSSLGFSEPWISPNKLGVKSLSGQKLLKELCSEMDHLQAKPKCSLGDEVDGLISILSEDMKHQTQNWEDCHTEVPGVVLDIERLIFKDLIGEVVSGELAGLQCRQTKHCRQLFSK
ncbi:unnamed protein product [Camellia sinensis]